MANPNVSKQAQDIQAKNESRRVQASNIHLIKIWSRIGHRVRSDHPRFKDATVSISNENPDYLVDVTNTPIIKRTDANLDVLLVSATANQDLVEQLIYKTGNRSNQTIIVQNVAAETDEEIDANIADLTEKIKAAHSLIASITPETKRANLSKEDSLNLRAYNEALKNRTIYCDITGKDRGTDFSFIFVN